MFCFNHLRQFILERKMHTDQQSCNSPVNVAVLARQAKFQLLWLNVMVTQQPLKKIRFVHYPELPHVTHRKDTCFKQDIVHAEGLSLS